jgi:membrane fusion protein
MLFRREAVEAQRNAGLGTINLATPVAFRWWFALAAMFTTSVVLILGFGHYTRRETVSGQLVPSAGLLTLSTRTTGTVTRSLVREGDPVAAGQPLVEVSGDLDSASMGDTHALVSAQLRAQKEQLGMILANLQPQATAQAKDVRSRVRMLQEQVGQIDEQLNLQRRQVAVSTELLKRVEPLHQRGIISTIQRNGYEATAISDEAGLKALERQRLDTEQQLSLLQAQWTQLPLDATAKASQLQGQLAQLDAQLAENEAARKTVVRASSAGVVSALLVKPGQNISTGQPLLSILPKGSKLEAQLLVPSSAIGFIEAGNRVVLRYQAFPFQKFGVWYGCVTQVSRSALTNAEGTSLLGHEVAAPLYRVLVAPDQQAINTSGGVEALRPGMELDADILLERRSLWQWVFEPLYGIRAQSAAEGERRE